MGRYFPFHRRLQSAPNVQLQNLQKECFKPAVWNAMFNTVTSMQTSLRGFWECLCLDFMWRSSRFQQNRQSYPNIHLQILQKVCYKTALSKERFNSVSWVHTSQTSFWEFFCVVFRGRHFHFNHRPQSAANVHLQTPQKECLKPALWNGIFNSVTSMETSLGSFWESFCVDFKWRYSRFQRNRESYPYMHLQVLQKECFKTPLSKERLNSFCWVHTSQSSFWEFFCLVFMGRYFRFHRRPQNAPNVHVQIPQKECFKPSLWNGRFNPVTWMKTSLRSFWECFC